MSKERLYQLTLILDKSVIDKRGVKERILKLAPCKKSELKMRMEDAAMFVDAIYPDKNVYIEASVRNAISGTHMVMASYYMSEERFVKH